MKVFTFSVVVDDEELLEAMVIATIAEGVHEACLASGWGALLRLDKVEEVSPS